MITQRFVMVGKASEVFPFVAALADKYPDLTLGVTQSAEECFWCGKLFTPTSHNRAHLGGHGKVYGCNRCLDVEEIEKEDN